MSGFSHRPSLKQKNKGFKSRHATKGSIKTASKGRPASTPSISSSHSNNSSTTALSHASAKKNRLNQKNQHRHNHAKTFQQDVKFFSTASGGEAKGVPRIVSVVPLHEGIRCAEFGKGLVETLGLGEEEKGRVQESLTDRGNWVINAPKHKTSLQLIHCPPQSLYATLDAALASDYVILLLSSEYEVTQEGEAILRCLQSVIGGGGGQAEVIACVQSPADSPMTPQTRPGILRSLLSFITYFFPSITKIHVIPTIPDASSSDANNLARAVCEGVPAGAGSTNVSMAVKGRGRDGRGWLVSEEGDFRENVASGSGSGLRFEVNEGIERDLEEKGTLTVTGTIRGARLSADRLVHIPGWGDYQVESILAAPTTKSSRPHAKSMNIDATEVGQVLSVPGEEADDLTALNEVDTMANEQTWPTEEEMAEGSSRAEAAAAEGSKGGRVKRVPKGTSAYQAAWILDEEEGEGEETIDEEDEMMDDEDEGYGDVGAGFGREGGGGGPDDFDGDETEEIELDSRRQDDDELSDIEEERQLDLFRKQRARENADDMHFPDEVDTPRHGLAQTRFQRFRGLKSFRTSPWDPYEDLPLDYARIFQFENYERTRMRVEEAGREEGVEVGSRIELRIKDVPKSLVDARDPNHPLVVYGLLQHEHKQSVLHFAVQRNTEYEAPVRAKDPLVLCVGPRRYRIHPIYSQHTRGGGKGVNNVHKSERYLRHGTAVVATTYGPVVFGKQSCVLLREREDRPEIPHLVAMGSFLNADPTRIIAKRIVLTGHPFKVHRKTATVRYMFFNRDDIEYFKPIELHTKYGRTGHIKEPLGTHGYMKVHFDQPIQQMDTVCMSLYKRQYPKQIENFVPPPIGSSQIQELDEDDEMDVE